MLLSQSRSTGIVSVIGFLLLVCSAASFATDGANLFAPCVACHGKKGEGNPTLNAPALAGQDAAYLERQLRNFRSSRRGTHKSDTLGAQMRPLAIALVMTRQRKFRQPRLPPHRPILIARHQLVRRIQRAQMHLDLIPEPREHRRPAARTEMPPLIVARLARDRHRVLREDRGGKEQRTMMLAAIKAVANPDAIGLPRGRVSDIAAQFIATNGASFLALLW